MKRNTTQGEEHDIALASALLAATRLAPWLPPQLHEARTAAAQLIVAAVTNSVNLPKMTLAPASGILPTTSTPATEAPAASAPSSKSGKRPRYTSPPPSPSRDVDEPRLAKRRHQGKVHDETPDEAPDASPAGLLRPRPNTRTAVPRRSCLRAPGAASLTKAAAATTAEEETRQFGLQ